MLTSSRALLLATLVSGFMAVPALAQTPATGTSKPAATTPTPSVKAPAATPAPKAKTAQQQRMTTCNQDAKGKTGDDRKAFMSSCLKGETAAPEKKLSASQERMKDCNAQAATKNLKGDPRKAFMSTCLKAK